MAKTKKTLTPEEQEDRLNERLGDLDDLKKAVESIGEHLACAETVETEKDFDANLDEAILESRELLTALCKLRHPEKE